MKSRILSSSLRRTAAFAAVLSLFCLPSGAGAGEVRIGGTGNALGTMRLLAEAFARQQPGTKPVVLDSLGSSGALRAVPKGAIEIGLSSRAPTEAEAQSGMTAVEYARSPTVFAVQEKNPASVITVQQVADIFAGRLAQWPDGTRIRPILRQHGDDNTVQIKRLSPAIEKALAVAEQRPGQAFATNDQEAADKLESIPGSFGVTTLALIRSERRKLRALALDGVEPTPEDAQAGRYPLVKRFFFILPKQPTPEAEAFVRFVQSPEGSRILEQTGHSQP